jgi:hypothetical protein
LFLYGQVILLFDDCVQAHEHEFDGSSSITEKAVILPPSRTPDRDRATPKSMLRMQQDQSLEPVLSRKIQGKTGEAKLNIHRIL